jgi:hypothetical protein
MLKKEIEIEGWVDYALFNNEIQIKIISQKNFRQTYFLPLRWLLKLITSLQLT